MTTKRRLAKAALAMPATLLVGALAGCSSTPRTEYVVVSPEPVRPILAAECRPAERRAWRDLPDRDVRRSDLARLWRHNRSAHDDLEGARRVCWASLEAQFPKPRPGKE